MEREKPDDIRIYMVLYTQKIKINGTLYFNNIGTSKKKTAV